MQPNKSNGQRSVLCSDLLDQIDHRNHLLGLAKSIRWQVFKNNCQPLYAASSCPGKPVRLMEGLLILKQLENLSDECVVGAWNQRPYVQNFHGQQRFTWKFSCDPPELTYFRRCIGKKGVRKTFGVSVALHGDNDKEAEVFVDSTVQEKNITFPTDAKLRTKIMMRYHTKAKLEKDKLRHSYQREIKSLLLTINFKSKGHRRNKSQRAIRRLQALSYIVIREFKGKLSLIAHTCSRFLLRYTSRRSSSFCAFCASCHSGHISTP